MLSFEEKSRLADHYAPILFFHPDENFDPIRVEEHIRRSALWCNKPVSGERTSWGNCKHAPEDSFPRAPLVERFNLRPEVVPGNIAGGPVWMGTQDADGFRPYQVSNEERELFLQRVSWFGGDGPDTDASAPDTPAENALSPDPLREETASYFVEVHDQDTVGTIQREEQGIPPPGFPNLLRGVFPRGYWLITYRFFSAFHVEELTKCETDVEVIRATRDGESPAINLHGSYKGDWYAVSMLVPNPGITQDDGSSAPVPVPASPLDLAEDEFPRPRFIGLSRRAKGVLTSIGNNLVESRTFSLMPVAEPASGDVRFIGSHPRIFVARGTHNLYVTSGAQTPLAFDPNIVFPVALVDVCLLAEDYDYILGDYEEVKEKFGDALDKGKRVGLSIGKILTGAATLGPFGAFGGAIASAMEGLLDPAPDVPKGPPPPPDAIPDEAPREAPQDGGSDFGTVAAPADLVAELKLDATIGAQALRVVPWGMDEFPFRLVERRNPRQPWWEPDGQSPTGYQGRWGARVTRDPFERRSGVRSPSFEATFINTVLSLPNI